MPQNGDGASDQHQQASNIFIAPLAGTAKPLFAAADFASASLLLTGILLYVIYVANAQGRTPHLHYAAIGLD